MPATGVGFPGTGNDTNETTESKDRRGFRGIQ